MQIAVLVDARNVLRSEWPNRSENELVELSCAWAARHGHRAVLVFDGGAPAAPGGDECRVIGTGAESADAWLERAAAEFGSDGRRYWLVTSDRALRAAAGRHAERVIGGGTFLRLIRGASE